MLKDGISHVKSERLKYRLNILVSPLYLYAINCIEGKTEKRFSQLTLFEQLKVLPSKLKLKVGQYQLNKFKQAVLSSQNAIFRQADILFYPVEPTHIKQMLPVSKLLKKSDYLYVTDRVVIYRTLIEKGIECILLNVNSYSPEDDGLKGVSVGRELNLIAGKLFDESESDNWITFAKNQINIRYPVLHTFISELLQKTTPKKVVVGYDITPEGRITSTLCKELGIKSVCIQHGSIAGEPLDGEHVVDNYLLYGEKAKEYLINIGNKPDMLRVFGAPYLDEVVPLKLEKQNFLKKLNLDTTKKTVMIALSGPGHCTSFQHFNSIVSSIVNLSSKQNTYNFVFKLHRKDSIRNYIKLLEKTQNTIPVIEASDKTVTNDIFTWLKAVDLLITGSSTVALEAMLLKVPVLTIDYHNEYQDVDFIEEGCTFHVDNESDLDATLSGIINHDDNIDYSKIQQRAKEYIREYFYMDDINTSKRIADWLLAG